jgi:hypothetical protein
MVNISSIVPVLRSSLKRRIVIAGTKKTNMNGIIENTLLREELLERNTSPVKNQPVIRRNTEMTIYATGEKKYAKSSRLKIGMTLFIFKPPAML